VKKEGSAEQVSKENQIKIIKIMVFEKQPFCLKLLMS